MALILAAEFYVTKNGFLPESEPSSTFRNRYYQPWERIATELPALLKLRNYRSAVTKLPNLSTAYLHSKEEWRLAYSILAFLCHAYIWGGDEPLEDLPTQLAVPFLAVSTYVEIPPVLTCAAVNLWNYRLRGTDLCNPDHLEILHTFTGTDSESWFLRIGIAIEATGGKLMEHLIDAMEATTLQQYGPITNALWAMAGCLRDITTLLGRIHEKCDPSTFCHQIRPFYAGSRNMNGAGLPRGVFYHEGAGKGEWRQLPGGSNGQSSLLQLLDIVIGVGYCAKPKLFHLDTRQCTPGPHRRFLEYMANKGSIRELALQDIHTEEHSGLREAYTSAAEELTNFRSKHIQIVTRYVAMQLKQPWHKSTGSHALPQLLSSGLRDASPKGTTGSDVLGFLKDMRNETTTARII
ncbi:hypothetical protein NLG97_g3431 [Lecanicillium saksenae]|uniref:Uncharacterized protein n=1 Tax=Lecanicillium saksenae TaxID=468837 RepID=A0ACC1QY31_9HYPO|nr:hypothetical protein NLG97_g3431 [Lecanicillium saksenae]